MGQVDQEPYSCGRHPKSTFSRQFFGMRCVSSLSMTSWFWRFFWPTFSFLVAMLKNALKEGCHKRIRACSWEVENNNRWKIVSFCGWKVTPWKFGNLCSFVFSMLGSAFWSWRTNYFRFHSQHDDLVFGEGQMALSKVGAFQDWGDGICPDSVSYLG